MKEAEKSDLLTRIARLARRRPTTRIESFCAALESGDLTGAAKVFPTATPRMEAQQLLEAWRDTGAQDVGRLAWALRAAAATDDAWRDSQKLELVWTGPSDSGGTFRRTDQALLELIDSARQELWIVSFVAYKIDAINTALQSAIDRGVNVSLVLETREDSGGKIGFDGIDALRKSIRLNSRVYVWPEEQRPETEDGRKGALHAKCAVADTRKLLVSSANLTDAAMQLNIELGLMITGGSIPDLVAHNLRTMVNDSIIVEV